MKKETKKKSLGKRIAKVIGIILLVLVAACGIVAAVFHDAARASINNALTPTLEMDTSAWTGGKSYEKVPYSEVSESDYVDIYVPEGVENPPLFVLVHGGGFIVNDSQARQTQWMYRYFRDHGYACATVNYRLADEAEYPGALEDVKACIRFLKSHAEEYGYDPERVALFGESAGAYLAINTAVSNDQEFSELAYIGQTEDEADGKDISASVNVLVDFYGSAEFGANEEYWKQLHYPLPLIRLANSWLSGEAVHYYESSHSWWIRKNESELTEEEFKSYSAYTLIEENISKDSDLAVYISHGDSDITVPILSSEKFYDTMANILGEDRVVLNIIPKAGHAKDIMYTDEELAKIDTFLREQFDK